jgi:hypothetical protein
MKTVFEIERQPSYSRGELLLRSFFGFFYILIPHAFVLLFLGLWGAILSFIAFWVILFTGRYPESFFEFQAKMVRWSTRVNATIWNLVDGYPAFGLNEKMPGVHVDIEYPGDMDRMSILLRTLFGFFYVLIPHAFILYFRNIGSMVLMILAWFSVLFTGSYPASWHRFNVGTLRWNFRVNLFLGYMTDEYPPFSGRPDYELAGMTPLEYYDEPLPDDFDDGLNYEYDINGDGSGPDEGPDEGPDDDTPPPVDDKDFV